jgi:tRNA G18 (ribose-2'-O)-methylase SpoU
MKNLIIIAHNLRSAHNVGSLLRTSEALGVREVYLTGYTAYPKIANDPRLPHISDKVHQKISKTALGAENYLKINVAPQLEKVIKDLRLAGFKIIALEQDSQSTELASFHSKDKLALILGNEVTGLDRSILSICDDVIEIPMKGQKESLNVIQAAAIAIYSLML